MNGNNLLLDTNIILYLLAGDKTLVSLLDNKTTAATSLFLNIPLVSADKDFARLTDIEVVIYKK